MMKKILFIALILIAGLASAQKTQFSATVGFVSATAKSTGLIGGSSSSISISTSETGFTLGINAEFNLSEKSDIRAGLLFVNVVGDNFLQSPILFKYEIVNKLSILVGPQITYTLEEVDDDFTKFSIGLGVGLNYDISDKLYIESRYTFQLNNYYTGPDRDILDATINFFNLGIGYRF